MYGLFALCRLTRLAAEHIARGIGIVAATGTFVYSLAAGLSRNLRARSTQSSNEDENSGRYG